MSKPQRGRLAQVATWIPEELKAALEERSATEGVPLKELYTRAFRHYLVSEVPAPSAVVTNGVDDHP